MAPKNKKGTNKTKLSLSLGLSIGLCVPTIAAITVPIVLALKKKDSVSPTPPPPEPVHTYSLEISESDQMLYVDERETTTVKFLCDDQYIEGEVVNATSSDESKLIVSVAKNKQQLFLMGVAAGSAIITINAQDTERHAITGKFEIEISEVKPYFVLKNNNTELWEVIGKTHTGDLKEVFIRYLDSETDKVVDKTTFVKTIEDLPADNKDYTLVLSGTDPIDAATVPIKTFPKNIEFLGTEGSQFQGFTFINDGSESVLPETVTFDGVEFTGDFTINNSNGNLKTSELSEWTLKNCSFTNDARINGKGHNSDFTSPNPESERIVIENCTFGQTDKDTKTTQILLDSNYFISKEFKVTNSTFVDSGYNCIQIQKPWSCAVAIEDNLFKGSINRPIRLSSRTDNATEVANLTIRDNLFEDCCDDADVEGTAYYLEQIYITGSGTNSFTKEMYESWTFEHNEFLEDDEIFIEPLKYIFNDTDWSWHQTTNGELIGYPDTYMIDPYVKNGSGQDVEIFQGEFLRYNCGDGTPATEYEQMNGNVIFTFNLATPSWGVDLTSGVTWTVGERPYNSSAAFTPITSGTEYPWLTWNVSTNNKFQITMNRDVLKTSTQISGDQFEIEAKYTDPESHTSKERTFIFNIWTQKKD